MRTIVLVFAAAILAVSASLSAQRRPADSVPQEQKVGVAIDLRVNSAAYTFKGQAVCEHLATGSIYNTMAERWSVRHDETGRNFSLTLWHPLSGGSDMVTLSISTGGNRHDVNTVKAPQATQTAGSATVRLARQGAGGVFTIDASTTSGAKIGGTVRCDAFTVSQPVAGN